ncbi:hypothetical protein HQ325_16625 [Rhodococcus sp. BP-349]|uniref:hypothetical protein n=1 Tax=unclassified Rhodococcus (in: high G+C Gram-positive bacteria) TaxID=192944 RepID=UPI001C9A468B|nr:MULTISPECIES: hypothetical protein [unclassified Rhodococcus (in: high G+C Gram-positive bacteria)]MBY6540300.1 hypothetical protein [Rhodococcus sp. BP-363]MBY6545675.1 hypothetical protein [Rhodococcus sp. BP-369]MBY6564905.1 hypothetical protein [Rhodococcus sp. BP-370]MBY6578159.1 hypothetical protein [Rhodococcus sp. BP-364]MBY6587460.1 hypothetical protein [Rhodococcus sp. BP-358]
MSQRSVPTKRRATAFSVRYAALGVGFAVGSLAAGPLLRVSSPAGAISWIGGGILTGALGLALITGRQRVDLTA